MVARSPRYLIPVTLVHSWVRLPLPHARYPLLLMPKKILPITLVTVCMYLGLTREFVAAIPFQTGSVRQRHTPLTRCFSSSYLLGQSRGTAGINLRSRVDQIPHIGRGAAKPMSDPAVWPRSCWKYFQTLNTLEQRPIPQNPSQ